MFTVFANLYLKSISWGVPGIWSDVVAVRSENKGISLLDLTPINMTDIELSSQEGFGTSITWSPDGEFLARLVGDSIHITDSRYAFCSSAHITIPGSSLRSIAFSPRFEESEECNYDDASLLAAVGLNGNVYMLKFTVPHTLELVESVFVEKSLWVVTWSKGEVLVLHVHFHLFPRLWPRCQSNFYLVLEDAKLLATGGKEKTLNVFSTETGKLIHKQSIKLDGRIWDIGFVQHHFENKNGKTNETCAMAVASGDYKTIFFDEAFQPTLQVIRSRTVRCLDYHPNSSLVAVGDGAGIVAIVDYREEETVAEFEVGGRVNVVKFSPAGDYLLVGTDDCVFTLREAVVS